MRFLFAIREPYLPEQVGGGVLDIHHLVDELSRQDHGCEVLATSMHHGVLSRSRGGRLVLGRMLTRTDELNGYTTRRAVSARCAAPLLRKRIRRGRPDVVVVQGADAPALARIAMGMGIPVLLRAVTVGCVDAIAAAVRGDARLADGLASGSLAVLSVSEFVAARAEARLGRPSAVLYPVIRHVPRGAGAVEPGLVAFVNPDPVKGVEIVLDVAARLPHRRFVLVESWALDGAALARLQARLDALPNVSLRRRAPHMTDVYERASLLLMPSQCEEAFGRVVVEAGAYGIPVVASDIGGIPEALDGGGFLLAPSAPAERWASTVERVLSDAALHRRLGAEALRNARRSELDARAIARRFARVARELPAPSAPRRGRPRPWPRAGVGEVARVRPGAER